MQDYVPAQDTAFTMQYSVAVLLFVVDWVWLCWAWCKATQQRRYPLLGKVAVACNSATLILLSCSFRAVTLNSVLQWCTNLWAAMAVVRLFAWSSLAVPASPTPGRTGNNRHSDNSHEQCNNVAMPSLQPPCVQKENAQEPLACPASPGEIDVQHKGAEPCLSNLSKIPEEAGTSQANSLYSTVTYGSTLGSCISGVRGLFSLSSSSRPATARTWRFAAGQHAVSKPWHAHCAPIAPYKSRLQSTTVHIKIPFLEPEDLPHDMLSQMQGQLQARTGGQMFINNAAIRRGCVELVLDVVRINPTSATPAQPTHVLNNAADEQPEVNARLQPQDGQQAASEADVDDVEQAAAQLAKADGTFDEDAVAAARASLAANTPEPAFQLSPLDWVHWLYLQPPADAEVLVQACGRAFVTCWDSTRQHWLTQELTEGYDLDGNKLPDTLPKVVHLEPPCLRVSNGTDQVQSNSIAPPIESSASLQGTATQGVHRLLLGGHNLHQPHASFAARFRGSYLHVEWRPIPPPLHSRRASMRSDAASPTALVASNFDMPETSITPRQASNSQRVQWIELLLHGIVKPGLLQLEGWCGRLLTCRRQLAVLTLEPVQRELCQNFSIFSTPASNPSEPPSLTDASSLPVASPRLRRPSRDVGGFADPAGAASIRKLDDLMTDLGCWVEFLMAIRMLPRSVACSEVLRYGSASSPAQGPTQQQLQEIQQATAGVLDLPGPLLQACLSPDYWAQMLDTAVQLLAHSCSSGWVETSSALFNSLLELGMPFSELKERTNSGGMTLLHRAVCSGSMPMVQLVVGWGEQHSDPWEWSEADPGNGITPLHIAAVMPVGRTPSATAMPGSGFVHSTDTGNSTLVDWILQEHEAACRYWLDAHDNNGMAPADLAEARGSQGPQQMPRRPAEVTGQDMLSHFPPAMVEARGPLALLQQHAALQESTAPIDATFDLEEITQHAHEAGGGQRSSSLEASDFNIQFTSPAGPDSEALDHPWPAAPTAGLDPHTKLVPRAEYMPQPHTHHFQLQQTQSSDLPAVPSALRASRHEADFQSLIESIQKGMYRSDPSSSHMIGLLDQALSNTGNVQEMHLQRRDRQTIPSMPLSGSVSGSGSNGHRSGEQEQEHSEIKDEAELRRLSVHSLSALPQTGHLEGQEIHHFPAQTPAFSATPSPIAKGQVLGSITGREFSPVRQPNLHANCELSYANASVQQCESDGKARITRRRNSPPSINKQMGDEQPSTSSHVSAKKTPTPQLPPDLEKAATAAATTYELVRASILQFRSQRLERGFLLWMQHRRQNLRLQLSRYMLVMLLVATAHEAFTTCSMRGMMSYVMFMLPWALVLVRHYSYGASRNRDHMARRAKRPEGQEEELWVAIMLWYLFVRCLQASKVLAVAPSVRSFLRKGGDSLSEGAVPLLFQVRTQPMALLRLLYTVSSTALYMRLEPIGLPKALFKAGIWNLLCLICAWVLDLINRRAYLSMLLANCASAAGEQETIGGSSRAAQRQMDVRRGASFIEKLARLGQGNEQAVSHRNKRIA